MKKIITNKSIICKTENLLECELDGEIIIMDSESGNYYNLNKIGGIIWNYLERPTMFKDIPKVF